MVCGQLFTSCLRDPCILCDCKIVSTIMVCCHSCCLHERISDYSANECSFPPGQSHLCASLIGSTCCDCTHPRYPALLYLVGSGHQQQSPDLRAGKSEKDCSKVGGISQRRGVSSDLAAHMQVTDGEVSINRKNCIHCVRFQP